jgi:hypothetical protein
VIECIADLLKHDKAGDPVHGLQWTRKTTRKIAGVLRRLGIRISAKTVGRLLREMGFSLRVNHKTLESGNKKPPPRLVRNRQFKYISQKRDEFASRESPIVSIDTKKKELVGKFKNHGVSWEQQPHLVKDHDFRSDAEGMAIPYGIYDTSGESWFCGGRDQPGNASVCGGFRCSVVETMRQDRVSAKGRIVDPSRLWRGQQRPGTRMEIPLATPTL